MILDLSSDDFDALMKTNIYAPFWIIKIALPHLKPASNVIGATSEQAYVSSPDVYDYGRPRRDDELREVVQLGQKDIRVNGVAPGPTFTPLQTSGGAPEQKIRPTFGHPTALGPSAEPAELAWIYVQLPAADAGFATGKVYWQGSPERRMRVPGWSPNCCE